MTSKIFRSTMFVAAVVLLCSLAFIMGVLYDYFDGMQMNQMKNELMLAAAGTELNGMDYLEQVESERLRITWIGQDGTVLFDNKADTGLMGNHSDREEIQEAVINGDGSSVRYSATLTQKTCYEAVELSDGSVLRVSVSRATSAVVMWGMLQPIGVVVLIAVALSAFLSIRMAKRIVKPLNELDLEHPSDNDVYEEITPLLNRIKQQHQQISNQMRKLKYKTDEFEQITSNMNEGLVLLDKKGTVLSINPAAKQLFGATDFCIGQDFLTVDRKPEVCAAMEQVFSNGYSQIQVTHNNREYQLDFSRIESQGSVMGAVILAFDITAQYSAEQTRREFSANVSHELKTPLQSIIGSAELLENGLVKQEDTKRFVGHIRKEATRLVSLIEDIIRLSQLDEGAEMPQEDVDLLEIAKDVVETLQPIANQKQVTLHVEGESCCMNGVRRLLHEIVYNLCENAIKYNVSGGSVTVRVSEQNGNRILAVADTGIGIPYEHQERVFERFYRVDKSHSKQSGGTGLGLSIVKHAAQYHNAKLELQSTPEVGTTITVIFP